jgi:hypothetical protein
MEMYE